MKYKGSDKPKVITTIKLGNNQTMEVRMLFPLQTLCSVPPQRTPCIKLHLLCLNCCRLLTNLFQKIAMQSSMAITMGSLSR